MQAHRWLTGVTVLAALVGLAAVTAAPEPSASVPTQAVSQPGPVARRYPRVPVDHKETAELLARVEAALRDPATPQADLPDLGHQQQVIYRVLSSDQTRSDAVLAALPPRWTSVAERHLAARREFLRMSRRLARRIRADLRRGVMPLWHDESHMNRYMVEHPPTRVLHPGYAFPEWWTGFRFPRRVIGVKKSNQELRAD